MVIFFKFRGYATGIAANGTAAMIVENLNRLRALSRVVVMQTRITNVGISLENTMYKMIVSKVYLRLCPSNVQAMLSLSYTILSRNKGNAVKNADTIQIKMIVMAQERLVTMDWYLRGTDTARHRSMHSAIRLKDTEALV